MEKSKSTTGKKWIRKIAKLKWTARIKGIKEITKSRWATWQRRKREVGKLKGTTGIIEKNNRNTKKKNEIDKKSRITDIKKVKAGKVNEK